MESDDAETKAVSVNSLLPAPSFHHRLVDLFLSPPLPYPTAVSKGFVLLRPRMSMFVSLFPIFPFA